MALMETAIAQLSLVSGVTEYVIALANPSSDYLLDSSAGHLHARNAFSFVISDQSSGCGQVGLANGRCCIIARSIGRISVCP
jgi:hypothetical protein